MYYLEHLPSSNRTRENMALINISDLNLDSSNGCFPADSSLIELRSEDAALICGGRGGWINRRRRQLAAEKLISAFTSRVSSVSHDPNQGANTFQIIVPDLSGSSSTANINGVDITYSGSLFYTDSGIAPIGASPIPGLAGAYTF